MAAAYLIEKGYQLVECNYRTSYGEIDLIMRQGSTIVFCEVKYRASDAYGDPLEAVNKRKQRKISHVAMLYYMTHGYSQNTQCRFDVIGIYGDESIVHLENAFDFVK